MDHPSIFHWLPMDNPLMRLQDSLSALCLLGGLLLLLNVVVFSIIIIEESGRAASLMFLSKTLSFFQKSNFTYAKRWPSEVCPFVVATSGGIYATQVPMLPDGTQMQSPRWHHMPPLMAPRCHQITPDAPDALQMPPDPSMSPPDVPDVPRCCARAPQMLPDVTQMPPDAP